MNNILSAQLDKFVPSLYLEIQYQGIDFVIYKLVHMDYQYNVLAFEKKIVQLHDNLYSTAAKIVKFKLKLGFQTSSKRANLG